MKLRPSQPPNKRNKESHGGCHVLVYFRVFLFIFLLFFLWRGNKHKQLCPTIKKKRKQTSGKSIRYRRHQEKSIVGRRLLLGYWFRSSIDRARAEPILMLELMRHSSFIFTFFWEFLWRINKSSSINYCAAKEKIINCGT